MAEQKTIAEWMTERGVDVAGLIAASSLDENVVLAIAECRYTPSPDQRRRLAAVLGVDTHQIVWGHRAPVEHVYGHGPQFGRSP